MRKIKCEIDANVLPKVLNFLEIIMKHPKNKKKKASYDAYKNVRLELRAESTGKYCYNLVIKCIANHRFEEAAKLYWMLCQDLSIRNYALYKVGMILLMNLESYSKDDCITKFFGIALKLLYLNKKEILLEFIMCALKYEFPDVQRQVKELTARSVVTRVRKHDKINQTLDSYIILLEWLKVFHGDMNVSQSQSNKEIIIPKKYDENSDIFILKLVKTMELCDKQNEIENVLLSYADCNLNNVNALLYICTYLYHNNPDSDKLIYYLEILAEKCVSDVRTLWLLKIWAKKGVSLLKILNYCFMFLDYPTNGKNVKAWKSLWKFLKKAENNLTEYDYESMQSLWESRRRSWTWMYFNPRQLPDMQSNNKLIAYKVAFLSVLGEGEKYVKKVSKYHPDILELVESLRN